MLQRPGQGKGIGPPGFGQPCQGRPTGIAQAQQLGGLVEGFAGRIVYGLAQQLVAPDGLHPHQLGMPARHKQGHEGKRGRICRQERRQQVALQMVHGQRRPTERLAQRRGEPRAHEQGTGQTRPLGESDHVDLAAVHAGLVQHAPGQRNHSPNVVTRGQLRHHATIGLVHVGLAVQGVRPQARQAQAIERDQRNASLVARGFDAQDLQCFSRA